MERVFIGTYTENSDSKGIYSAVFSDGYIEWSAVCEAVNPSYIAARGDRLYAVEETNSGGVCAYHIGSGLSLAKTGARRTLGDAPCHVLCIGNTLYVSNYTSGSLAAFPLAKNGDLRGPPRLILHEGCGPDLARQRSPHVHQAVATRDGRFLAVCDLGIDRVVFYPLGGNGPCLPGEPVRVPGGTGPRHAVFGANGMWYVVCELSCEVLVYHGYGRAAVLAQRMSAARGAGKDGACAALRLSPDGKLLMASVRGADTLALFDVSPEDGRLSVPRHYAAMGNWPRDAAFTPDGRYALCACEKSDRITVFAVVGGALAYRYAVPVPRPACVCFA